MRESEFGCFPSKSCMNDMYEGESDCNDDAGEGGEGLVPFNSLIEVE